MLHAHHGKCLCRHLHEQEGNAGKRAYVRFMGGREKNSISSVEFQGRALFDTMQASLWRETLGRCLDSHGPRDPIGGLSYATGCCY